MIRYPILIEEGTKETAFGIVVPDLPGCFSAGDSLDEAVEAAKEAAAAWIDTALDHGVPVPPPSTLEAVRKLPGYRGWAVGLVEIEEALLDDAVERVNITLPRRVLRRLDDMARRTGQTRSGLIARLTVSPPSPGQTPQPVKRQARRR
jgi:predicted RNase H-like HicB family nuclease